LIVLTVGYATLASAEYFDVMPCIQIMALDKSQNDIEELRSGTPATVTLLANRSAVDSILRSSGYFF